MAGSKALWEELQLTLLRIHEDAPVGTCGTTKLGVENLRRI